MRENKKQSAVNFSFVDIDSELEDDESNN